ncbi:DEAD/DEAH box helicase [Streptomyces longwoodensis]|uniref:DEAD/DEAH box helicase n=1 Tax=Streptomyces longwoodensis TaxID=68231 RepID=UPI00224FA23C|nr:DEAD/DEAH box helicase [Streptomyces longwoodensis]MCX5000887.1 Helicase associated domain protein [Streptomyces longwoodensis]
MAHADLELRPHQKEAVGAAARTLRANPRTSVIAACGTGKTVIAARTAHRVTPHGRVLVLVPTLDLLAQTATVWRAAGRKGPAIAVCSARQALDHDPIAGDTPMTTSPAELAALLTLAADPVTVYATYASLPAVIAAHRDHGLPPWDLVVVDEAHRTAGRLGKAWAAVHHDDQVPAARRLYLTATPRIWDPDDASDGDGSETVASMDDETLFGPVAYHLNLSDAIDLGLLADYQILVPVVTDANLRDWLATGAGAGADGLHLAGRQVAALRAIHDHRLRRILTFHHRVADARAFATTLAETAAALPASLRPQGLWADWVSGGHSPQIRRRLLLEFTSHTSPDAPAVLSNARVLGEGIDVPDIDAVVFVDPKNSPVDTVQAVGRALRQQPGAGKKATLVVPVYLTPDEDPDDLLGADAYTPLWRTIQALRAHDDRLDARLSDPRTHRPTMPPEDPEAWLRFDRPTQADEIALALSLRVLAPKSAEWRRGLTAARRFRHTHRHLDVPQTYEDPTGYPLGRWLTWQRHLHTKRTLDAVRVQALERLGIIWDPRQAAFERGLAHAAAYAAQHGHLAAPVDESHDGFPLGRWLATQRTRAETLTHERAAALAALDRWWNPPWPITWQRAYHAALRQTEKGTAASPGEWLTAQRERASGLHPEQRHLLKSAGLDLPAVPASRNNDAPLPAREQAFQRGLAAARSFRAREGHLNVPQRHIEEIEGDRVRLGQWLSNLSRRRSRLSPQRQAAVAELGL